MIPYYIYVEFEMASWIWGQTNTIERIVVGYIISAMFAIYAIHMQWYYLILRGLGKMLGIIKSKPR